VDGVEPWWRHAGCEPAQQGQRIHVDRDRPVGVGLLQGDAHEAVGALLHSLLRNRGAQDVSQQRLSTLGVEAARSSRRMQGEPIKRSAQRLVVGECSETEGPKAARPLRPGRRRLAGDRGGGEAALGVALAAEVEVVVPAPEEATPVKVTLDPPDRLLQDIAHLAGLQMSKARKDQLVPLLGPGAVQSDRVEMWIEPHVG
jgi:hypothetical protein